MTAIPGSRRRAPALAFAAQALAGSVRNRLDDARALPQPARGGDGRRHGGARAPRVPDVLRQLTPDEVRIISTFQHDGPYPLVTVGARYRFGERLSTELRHFSLLGDAGGLRAPRAHPDVHRQPLPAGPGRASPGAHRRRHAHASAPLESHAQVKAAIARIEARIPELESAQPSGDDGNRVVADVQRTALYVTAFGRQFYEACEYRPEHAR